jgi:hypothetical protein
LTPSSKVRHAKDFDHDDRHELQAVPLTDLTLRVTESSRHGAPMTMVRGGEERDLAAIAAMGRVRAEHFRLHLDSDIEFIQYAITTKLIGVRMPGSGALAPSLSAADVLFWRNDLL